MRTAGLFGLLLCSGCTAVQPVPTGVKTVTVAARGETVPVGTDNGDAADDPAIWRNPRDPAASLIVGTDKKAGLYVYGLDGKVRDFNPSGRLNNVDLVDMGPGGIVVAASDRNDPANAKLRLFRLDAGSGKLSPLGLVDGGKGEAYGICLWQSGGELYAFSVLKEGTVHQVRIHLSGEPRGTVVRTLKLASQPEGCVVDPRSKMLFVGEEDVGIWRFDARANGLTEGRLAARADGMQLVADVEGLAIAPSGRSGGYLIASSQGDNAYALYSLPDLRPAGRFRVGPGKFGATEETDGIAFHAGAFGPDYPNGLVVVQDGVNPPRAQNFKLVSWADVLSALRGE